MSSPRLNNLVITGSIIIYVSGVLIALDSYGVSKSNILLCRAYEWTLCIGFTLAFGAMFSKTWRVHVIVVKGLKTKRKVIKDTQLFGIVAGLLSVDIAMLGTKSALDPLQRAYADIGKMNVNPTELTAIQHYIRLCNSSSNVLWEGLIFGYKGILLFFSSYLAYETRNVTVAALNDSKFIGLSVYNIFVPVVLGIPIVHLLREDYTVAFIITMFLILYPTTITLCLVFIPKILAVKRDPLGQRTVRFYASNSVSTGTSSRNQGDAAENKPSTSAQSTPQTFVSVTKTRWL